MPSSSRSHAPIGLYVHVPFCSVLCPYCDFVKAKDRTADRDAFVAALVAEIAAFEGPDAVSSVFLGGGTPSLLSPEQIAAVFDGIRRRFRLEDPEVSLEANPEDIDAARLDAWQGVGITRVSVGVQSFDDDSLRYLGRNHSSVSARSACERVAAQFSHWSLDLMFGLPSAPGWQRTLEACGTLTPPHVSAYGLTYEPGTPFARRTKEAVADETYVEQYWAVCEALPGLDRYEVSNLAAPGHACRHNLIYWRNEEYAGLGPGAYSYLQGVRARNSPSIRGWLDSPGAKVEALALSRREQQTETLIQGLRLAEGIAHDRYRTRFGSRLAEDFAAPLASLMDRGLIEDDGVRVRPTARGFELNDEIGLALVCTE